MQQFLQNPLKVIIDPAGIQFGMPGDTIDLHITVINEGSQSAVIELFLDEGLQSLTRDNVIYRENLALDQQQSQEVTFEIAIPLDALPGTYDYTLVVDSPRHYPQYTPISYPRQVKILLKEQTVVRENDPTFSVLPTTNPNKPLVFKGEPLELQVTVDNRSSRVDRFRLNCPDFDEDWFTITYPRTGSEGQGLLSETNGLELLPGVRGQIKLDFHPPTATLAGNYSPTIRLYSENSPDLILLELVYILVPTIHRLDVNLNTILGQVSRSPGKYQVKLTNQGNTVREVILGAKSRDEEEICIYNYSERDVRLLPSKNAGVDLTVKPVRWWRRPLFGRGLTINFEVELQDQQNLPLPETLPHGTLLWKARPWWQFLLLLLLILGAIGGIGYLVWRVFHPDPLTVENFRPNNTVLTEGNEVLLNWDIHNYKELQRLTIIQTEPQKSNPTIQSYNSIQDLISKNNSSQTPPCQLGSQKDELICRNVKTGVTQTNKYTFQIQADYNRGVPFAGKNIESTTPLATKVEIDPKKIAEVVNFDSDKAEYTNGESILFNWTINRSILLKRLEITDIADDGTSTGGTQNYDFVKGVPVESNLKKLCKEDNQQLTCTKVPVTISKLGNFTFTLTAFSTDSDKISSQKTQNKIKVLPKPVKSISFTLNNTQQPPTIFPEGSVITLRWNIDGDPQTTQVELSTKGTVPLKGEQTLRVDQSLRSPITLTVTPSGQPPIIKQFNFAIKPKPTPTPIIPNIFLSPTPKVLPTPQKKAKF